MEETAQENLKLALEPFWTFVCDVEGDLVGYVTDDKQVQRVMLEYEKATLTQYFIYSSESFPRLKLHTLDLSRKNVRFVDRVVHTAGVPFVTISAMIRLCSRGGTYRCTKKSQNERERKSRKNVKVGCTSKIYVKQVLLFPEFKESDTLRSKSQISDSVKEEMKNGNYGTICYFISFPSLKSHCNHSIDKEGSAQTKRIDKRLVEELKRLVNDKGIVCDEQLQVKLIQFVEREINPVPSRSDAAYFPALSIIRNHRTKFLKSRGDPSLWLNSVRFRKMNKALIVELRRLILTENIVCTSTLVERLKRYVDLNIHPQPNENDKAFYPSVVTVRKHKSHILHQSEKMAKDGNDVNIPTTNPPVDTTEPSTLDTSSLIPTTRETCEGMLDPDASPLYLTVPISYPANTYTEVPPLPPLPPEPPEICRDTMPPDEAPAYHNMISQYENIPAVDSIPADIQLFAMTATPSSQNATSTITQHCELSMPVGNELMTHQSVIVKRDLVYDQPMDLVTEHSNVIHTLTDANAHELASARLDTVPCMQTDAPQEHVIPHVHINPQGTSCHSVEDQNASQEQNIHAIPDPDVAPACGNTQITQNVDVSMQPAGQAWKNTFQDELLRCYELAISSCTIISDKEGDSLTKELQELRVKLQSLTESDVTNVVNRDMHVNPVVNRDMHVNPVVNRDMHVNPPTSAHSGPAQQSTSSIIGLCTATQPRHNKSMTKQTVLVNHETSKAKRRSRRQVSVETSPRRTRKLDTTSSSILTNLIKKHNIV